MNLHIVPDNVFINKFYENLIELGIDRNNKIVVRTNLSKLKYLKHNFPYARLYSSAFDALTGDTAGYQKVFIHQFTPLLYRWVATRSFRELNWMVWGSDLYNVPSVKTQLYEELTLRKYMRKKIFLKDYLYRAKLSMLHMPYQHEAYRKVNNLLTWMPVEYNFALQHLPALQAGHQFFFYENDLPYQLLNDVLQEKQAVSANNKPLYILGNSSTPELNHLDAVSLMDNQNVKADLYIPLSYGAPDYARFLKKNLSFYKRGAIRFIDRYMSFPEYLQFLHKSDGLIMNNIRPQGYGNIFMMMYLGKKIFLNGRNLSLEDLNKSGLLWQPLEKLENEVDLDWKQNQSAVVTLLAHDRLLKTYRNLFS
jgi:dTDP-N-acetylfucosamine:lipid II N-acetylfucosaminyltransferase